MRVFVISIASFGLLAGCAELQVSFPDINQKEQVPEPVQGETELTSAPAPVENARTVEQFDTTTAEQRQAAATGQGAGRKLGVTIASLGAPTEPGFWLKTPLVSEVQEGYVQRISGGERVAVELRPLEGSVGAGSQISLPAMRLLNIPLTDLPELVVYGD